MDHYKKRGRKKFTTDTTALTEGNTAISFNPNRITREELAYCMKETGVYNKSAVISIAIRHYNDHLVEEARRRLQMQED